MQYKTKAICLYLRSIYCCLLHGNFLENYFDKTILKNYFENTILFSIFKILFSNYFIFYFQNTFKNYFGHPQCSLVDTENKMLRGINQ